MNWFKRVVRNWLKTHMPLNLVLLRHGESEGNWALDLIKQGRYSEIPVEMHGKPGWQWRLTEKGVQQAITTGEWMRRSLPLFDAYFVSPHNRALETGDNLNYPGKVWRIRLETREREYGVMDHIPKPTELEEFARLRKGKKENPLHWSLPGGESIVDTISRAYRTHSTLHREHEDESVLVVCHGEVIEAHIVELCRLTPEEYYVMRQRHDKLLEIDNCQIVHFTRVDPETGQISEHLDWVRSICPSNETDSEGTGWLKITRELSSNQDLQQMYEKYPRYSG